MPKLSELITMIDTTYRNVYTTEQKVNWMDMLQKQIFQVVPKESIPFEFYTITDVAFYNLPYDCDRQSIQSVTIEDKAGSKQYKELPYISLSSNQNAPAEFYSLLDGMFMIQPVPTIDTENKRILMMYTQRAPQLDPNTLDQVPMLEEDFHQLLVYGVCREMAVARGETEDMNIFDSRYTRLFRDYEKQYGYTQPEYKVINDVMPRGRNRHGRRYWAR